MDPLLPPIPVASRRRARARRRPKNNSQSDLNILASFSLECQSKKWPFITRHKKISCIVPTDGKNAWFAFYGWHKFYLVTTEGQVEKTVKLGSNVTHTTMTSDGEMLLACDADQTVKKLNQKGDIQTLHVSHLGKTRGLCACRNGDILLCVVGNGNNSVVRLSASGHTIQEIQYGENRKRLFQYPYHVVENVNGNICVTDIDANCVVVLNQDGEKRFRYYGCQRPEILCKFCPYGIVCSSHGNIFVTDYWNHCIHILDCDGNFLSFLLTQTYRLEYPLAIGRDCLDQIWVSTKSGKVFVCQELAACKLDTATADER